MERILAIRRRIGGITYSKKTISVEFLYGRLLDPPSGDFSRPPDGKRTLNQNLTPVPHSGTKSFCPPARTSESNLCPPAEKKTGSVRDTRTDPFQQFVSTKKVGTLCLLPKTVTLSFPNIAHDYWDHFRLTGDYYIRPARAPHL